MQRTAWCQAGNRCVPRKSDTCARDAQPRVECFTAPRRRFEDGCRSVAQNGGQLGNFFRLAEAGTEGAAGGAAGCRCRRGNGDLDEHLVLQAVRTHRTPLARHLITLAARRPHHRPRTDPDSIPHCVSVLSLATATNSVHLDSLGRIGGSPLLYGLSSEGRSPWGSALGWGYGRSLVARSHGGRSPAICATPEEF